MSLFGYCSPRSQVSSLIGVTEDGHCGSCSVSAIVVFDEKVLPSLKDLVSAVRIPPLSALYKLYKGGRLVCSQRDVSRRRALPLHALRAALRACHRAPSPVWPCATGSTGMGDIIPPSKLARVSNHAGIESSASC